MGFGLSVLGFGLVVLIWNGLFKRRYASAGNSTLSKLKRNTENLCKLEISFVEGMHVEVSRNKKGFGDAWFIATIIKEVGENKFLVEYQTLRKENENQLLIKEVNVVEIRPTPPHENLERGGFARLEKVDAFYNAGWWVGIIFKVHDDSSYSVYFREICEEFKFKHWQLRLHQEWINGKWVRVFKA
ncbi:hypothetical protein IFM89_029845 [Coptis chinensis]|uniref:Agenet domain-containing protein n=1 Tax=Coptis chinensis TaxID=261450 RepID=A0A835LX04_9MAGN|nr:hypothetical protein IFM89_029845 [Coptis chinensis]